MTLEHKELTRLGAKWLRSAVNKTHPKCHVVIEDMMFDSITSENPDILGWCYYASIMIEVKVSRSDFKADSKKPFRRDSRMGCGDYRYYLCPDGMIKEDELPSNWGLLYQIGKKVRVIRKAEMQDSNYESERKALIKLIRNLNK